MSNRIDLIQTEEMLRRADDIIILTHRYPDGDTLGSSYALCRILRGLGKTAHVRCPDPIPARYEFLRGDDDDADETHIKNAGFIVAADVASPHMLGPLETEYAGRVDLCIDHHESNAFYAAHTFVDTSAAAVGEIIYDLWQKMDPGQNRDTAHIADCLFTSITTDTGCFRYRSVTPRTHEIAAGLLHMGADGGAINRAIFETKTRSRMRVEQEVLSTLRFYDGDAVAVITLSRAALRKTGADEGDLDGLSAIPRRIEGVKAGVFLRETSGGWKLSMRTAPEFNASEICARLGGGGHPAAAGAALQGDLPAVTAAVLDAIHQSSSENETSAPETSG
ncbi:MAG: DHH family phosphoesterase [Oscillospiraceae bacterium]|nr:DHH family phosphoesterase [Oscillospiraceae bacterium]